MRHRGTQYDPYESFYRGTDPPYHLHVPVCPKAVKEALDAYKKENDNVRTFLDDQVVEKSSNEIEKQEFYEAYRDWCDGQGERPVSQKKLHAVLQEVYPNLTDSRKGARGPRIWGGIGLKNESQGE